ncbi:MAG: DNA polymerase Y family protein [Planctomycetes bacterium]|nr:DNA polymerase Y family protein [Planctomycetota bacterium]
MRRVLCLHMPHLATERARRAGVLPPGETERPLVLVQRKNSTAIVAEVCPQALRRGLRVGVSLGEAQARVPDLTLWPHEPQRDRALLGQLANWALRFTPLVEAQTPNTLLLDVTGCQRLFGDEQNLAQQAQAGLVRQGLQARAALADTVGAAYALASAGSEAVVVVPTGCGSAYLAPLPAAALRIAPAISARLYTLGVRTIGDLLHLPRASLPARFGQELVLRLQQALGEVFEPVAVHDPGEPPQAEVTFDAVVRDLVTVQVAAERLLEAVFAQVLQRELGLRRLECVLYYERVPPVALSLGMSRTSRAREHIAELLRRRLEGVDVGDGLSGLKVIARETARWQAGQGELFEPRDPGADEALGCLIDRVVNRLGAGAVMRAQLVDDYEPEWAFRYVSVVEAGCVAEEAGAAETGLAAMTRPVRLLPCPLPVRVIALCPDGPPTWFGYRDGEHVVARAEGPERLETAWWRGGDVRRDYFRITSESGEQFWVFCTLPERRWFLHGVFA